MKRLMSLFFTAVVLSLVLLSCEKTPDPVVDDSLIELSGSQKDNTEIKPEGESVTIRFTAAEAWTIRAKGQADWLEVDPAEGAAGMARVKVKASVNDTPEARTAVLEICAGTSVKPITFTQESFIPTFELLETEKSMSCLGGNITIKVYADVDYHYESLVDWIKPLEPKAPRNRSHEFVIEPNNGAERTGMITFCAGETCKSFTVKQRAGGTEADDWKNDEFKHRSLAMRFTADWCGYCPYMGTAFDAAKTEMSGNLEIVSLHGGGSTYDFIGTNDLMERFRVSGFPTGVVDARASVYNSTATAVTTQNVVDVATESAETYPTTTGIECSSTLDGSSLNVNLNLYTKEADTYRVVVLVLEDKIIGYQNNGGNDYNHKDVARLALTSMNGTRMQATEDYQVLSETFSGILKSSWNTDNLKLLIYVEKPYGDRDKVAGVKNSYVSYGSYGDTYIDNCRVVKIGENAKLELK